MPCTPDHVVVGIDRIDQTARTGRISVGVVDRRAEVILTTVLTDAFGYVFDEEPTCSKQRSRERTFKMCRSGAVQSNPSVEAALAPSVGTSMEPMSVTSRTETLAGRPFAALEGARKAPLLVGLPVTPFYLILGHLSRAPVGLYRSLGVQMGTNVLGDQVLAAPTRVDVVALPVNLDGCGGLALRHVTTRTGRQPGG